MSSEKGRTFSHLQWKDRLKIEKMLKEKKSKSEIARTLRVGYTTVMREIKRAKGPDIKIGNDHELAQYIEDRIADDGYSSQAALYKIEEDNLSFSVKLSKWTVYKYINDGVFLRLTNKSQPMGRTEKAEARQSAASQSAEGGQHRG